MTFSSLILKSPSYSILLHYQIKMSTSSRSPKKRSNITSEQTSILSPKNKKRQCVEDDDIRCVTYPFSSSDGNGTIITPVISTEVKQMLLDRFREELLAKFDGSSWNRGRKSSGALDNTKSNDIENEVESPMSIGEKVIRSRLFIGENTMIQNNVINHFA